MSIFLAVIIFFRTAYHIRILHVVKIWFIAAYYSEAKKMNCMCQKKGNI